MTDKTKRQQRAEAVERLKELEGKAASYAGYCRAMVDWPISSLGQISVTRFIDLLTDEELPEGDAVGLLRTYATAEQSHDNPEHVLLEKSVLGELADMIERDYVRRDVTEGSPEWVATLKCAEWMTKAYELERERDEWKAKADQAQKSYFDAKHDCDAWHERYKKLEGSSNDGVKRSITNLDYLFRRCDKFRALISCFVVICDNLLEKETGGACFKDSMQAEKWLMSYRANEERRQHD